MTMRDLWTVIKRNPQTCASILSGYYWAALLVAPGETIARPTYRYMRTVLPEDWMWATVFIVLASAQLGRMWAKSHRKTFLFDLGLRVTALFVWLFTAIACLSAQWPLAAAMADTVVVVHFALWDVLRLHPCDGCGHRHECAGRGDCWYDR